MVIPKYSINAFNDAFNKILEAVNEKYYKIDESEWYKFPNYSEICDWCGFPDLQDGGYWENIIDLALNAVKILVEISTFKD